MEVWASDPAALAHGADPLASRDGLTLADIAPAEMEVRGYQSRTVIDVDRPACQVKVGYQCHDAASCRPDRRSDCTREIRPQMPALYLAVEYPGGTERAGDPAGPGQPEGTAPQSRPLQ